MARSNSEDWIELAANTAVLATLATWEPHGWVGPVILNIAARWPVALEYSHHPIIAHALWRSRRDLHPSERMPRLDLTSVVERVRAEWGLVLPDPLDVIALAGKKPSSHISSASFARCCVGIPGP